MARRLPCGRLCRIIFFCVACLTFHVLVLLGAIIFGYSFVPSQTYVSDHDVIAKSLAIPGGCLVFVLCCRKFAKDFQSWNASAKTIILSGFNVLMLPFLFGIVVRATVLTAYPLWSAALMGKDTQLEFSVDHVGGASFRCPNRLDLAGMPIMTGTLCGIPKGLRNTLHQGIRVALSGRGTADGLFAATIDVVH